MGTEYKISLAEDSRVDFDLEHLRGLKHFWKIDKEVNSYFLGKIDQSDWPEVMIWEKDGDLGVTLNHAGEAWCEFKELVSTLKRKYPGLTITDWDSGEDLNDDFFS